MRKLFILGVLLTVPAWAIEGSQQTKDAAWELMRGALYDVDRVCKNVYETKEEHEEVIKRAKMIKQLVLSDEFFTENLTAKQKHTKMEINDSFTLNFQGNRCFCDVFSQQIDFEC